MDEPSHTAADVTQQARAGGSVCPPERRDKLVLVGMMGAGKTTVGRLLSERTGRSYTDNDALVRTMSGREPREIDATDGEDALHRLESAAILDALAAPGAAIVGAAAAVVMDPDVVPALRQDACVVWLRARPETLRARIGSGAGRRVEATDLDWLTRQAEAREARYTELADLIIDVDDLTARQTADLIAARLID